MNKNITVEISVEKPEEKGYSYAKLGFPATSSEILDLKHRARLIGRENAFTDIRIIECPKFNSLVGTRINDWSYKELSFLAHRLQNMTEEELISLNAIFETKKEDGEFLDGVDAIELVNMTYGHENVMIASYVTNLELLGKFSIENGLYTALPEIPEIDPTFLNLKKVGELQQKSDGGIFYDKYYVVAGEYKPQKVYTSETVPELETDEFKYSVFSILLGKSTSNIDEMQNVEKEWFHLPMESEYLEKEIKERLGCSSSDIDCYEVKSAIPQINMATFSNGLNIFTLNELALEYKKAKEIDKIKFKAVLEGQDIATLSDAADIFNRLSAYEIAPFCDNSEEYFKEYLSTNMEGHFDDKWLKYIECKEEGIYLMNLKGAVFTQYGIISNGKNALFSLVPYEQPVDMSENEEVIKTGGMTITKIDKESLKQMNNKEGLILQGCGGEIYEWVDGINQELKDKKILLEDTKFQNVSVFEHKHATCILYPFDDNVRLDIGKFAMWRIKTKEQFGSTWLSDFVNNELGGFENDENINEGMVQSL